MKKILLLLTLVLGFIFSYGQDCSQGDGTFSYHALLTSNNIPTDFDKDDFINYILGLDNISNEDLATLNTHITSVYRAYPTAQSEYLQRVVIIDATIEIYSILSKLINSIEYFSCIDDEIILGINDNRKDKSSIVYPNPITENSVIKLNSNSTNVRIEIINSLGQRIYHKRISGQTAFWERLFWYSAYGLY